MSLVLAAVAACSSGGSSSDEPAAALADRVQAVLASADGGRDVVGRLEAFGVEVSAEELAGVTPRCPRVDDPAPGDEATCRLTVGAHELDVEVEFEADGTIELVDVGVAP